MFSTKGKRLEELELSVFAKKVEKALAMLDPANKDLQKQRALAVREAQLYHLAEILAVSAPAQPQPRENDRIGKCNWNLVRR